MSQLQKCGKPDCMRKVMRSVAFCCGECWNAAVDECEIDRHSVTCDARSYDRGLCTPQEAILLSQVPAPVATRPGNP